MRLVGYALAQGILTLGLLVGCGAKPQVEDVPADDSQASESDNGADGGSTGGDLSDPDLAPDKVIDIQPDEHTACTKTTCDELGFDCGQTADGCGGVLDCGGCDDGSECGIVEHNTCTEVETLCVPVSKAEACDGKQCGSEGDGCGDLYDCGECDAGQACGLDEPFQCGTLPPSSDEECTAKVESCAAAGVNCGKIGNGCGGLIDCDAELGGCGDGQLCGLGGANACGSTPTCEPIAAEVACAGKCGMVSNGCGEDVDGGLIDCSNVPSSRCSDGTACGAGGVPNQCGSSDDACVAIEQTIACANVECGAVGDGCEGSYACGACGSAEQCRQGLCQPLCVPLDQATACSGKACGSVSDNCGGSYQCGTCQAGQQCGLSQPFQCATIPSPSCQKLSAEQACAGRECGTVYDGCGTEPANVIDCAATNGGCQAGEYCGVVAAFQCDEPPAPDCTAASSCAQLGWECGVAFDECGTAIDCSLESLTCDAATEVCVGGIDGPTQCSTSGGGSGSGFGDCDVCDSIPNCVGQGQLTQLTGRVVTPGRNDADTANQVGVPNAFVYILRSSDEDQLPDVSQGIAFEDGEYATSCDRCEDQDLGPVLASATTDATGHYTLEGNIPVGEAFILVVKIGKWRRAESITLDPGAACATTTLASTRTRLPRNNNDGLKAHIPHIAVSTGRVDAMECVFYKLGVDSAEFAQPGAAGDSAARIHMYRSESQGGASMADGSTGDSALYTNQTRLFGYDMVVFDCEGNDYEHNTDDPTIREFVNRGGRMFASHWSYTWIHDNGAADYSQGNPYATGLSQSATWGSGSDNFDTAWVSIERDGANPAKIFKFAEWLSNESAASVDGQGRYAMSITDPRDLARSVGADSEEFVYRSLGSCGRCTSITDASVCTSNDNCTWGGSSCAAVINNCAGKTKSSCQADSACSYSNTYGCRPACSGTYSECSVSPGCGWTESGTSVQQYAFNTPYGAPDDEICGRVAYSGFHVVAAGSGNYSGSTFPEHCSGDLTSQEKVLLYMLFDLGACVSTDEPEAPTCTPRSASACAGRCGLIADGCGGTLDCSACPSGEVCSAAGVCGAPACKPTTCASQGATCGSIADGCGGVLVCGPCDNGQQCGLLTPNQCAPVCTPIGTETACADACGFVSDGCGGVYECGGCDGSLSCQNEACVTHGCTPLKACPPDAQCGQISDGCDGMLNCGSCVAPQTCGGGGVANQCGAPQCAPLTCSAAQAQCGWIGDGCGLAVNCGSCPAGQVCGAGGPNTCAGCVPRTCADAGAQCGAIGDGCGGVVQCGSCTGGKTCGAEAANQCGSGPMCKPRSCASAGAECGTIGDGCGGTVQCSACADGKVCGIDTPFKCGDPPACQPLSCQSQGAECGAIGDGCGGLVDCGGCGAGGTCGIASPNKCSYKQITK